ncbi:hypothetical protein ADIS_4685 [Lunatimonas lonarensis]|uniref:Uncharacterized protein n=1 Tax=Lunatimonas lonarensis TaxID=1232681 RepID=R7ZL86_9BACT|nr:hypothetical protein ADIS_4685 [Lunatimonas lonarensis]
MPSRPLSVDEGFVQEGTDHFRKMRNLWEHFSNRCYLANKPFTDEREFESVGR